MRPDERCALKGCDRPLPPLAVEHRDPFHSSVCSRRFHGVVFSCGNTDTMARSPTGASRDFMGRTVKRR